MCTFHIFTIFPNILDSYFKESILKKAIDRKRFAVKFYNIRDFCKDKHRTVDDTPYGGGPGMVMKIEPIYKALKTKKLFPSTKTGRIILLSPRGKVLDTRIVKRLATYKNISFICGRYEAVDERVAEHIADEVISIGDYTLAGGELAAAVIIESIARHIPGVVGNKESVTKQDFPQYTKPDLFSPHKKINWAVPAELLSGNHAKIKTWRENQIKK